MASTDLQQYHHETEDGGRGWKRGDERPREGRCSDGEMETRKRGGKTNKWVAGKYGRANDVEIGRVHVYGPGGVCCGWID